MLNHQIYLPSVQPQFDGIISDLQSLYKNDIWQEYVTVSVSSTNQIGGSRDPINLINRTHEGDSVFDNWCSHPNEDNGYLIMSFPKFYVYPYYYVLQSKTNEVTIPVVFNVSVSIDKKQWIEI